MKCPCIDHNKSFTVTPFDKSWSQRDLHTSLQNLNKLYSSKHEWVEVVKGDVARVGMTEYAVDALGDVVFAQLHKEVFWLVLNGCWVRYWNSGRLGSQIQCAKLGDLCCHLRFRSRGRRIATWLSVRTTAQRRTRCAACRWG